MPLLEIPLMETAAAPEPVRATLEGLQKKYGFLPNLYRVFAHSPQAIDAYLAVSEIFQRTSFTDAERNVILLSVSVANRCTYCAAVHSATAAHAKVAPHVIEAIRDDDPIDDRKLAALRELTVDIVRRQGRPQETSLRRFFDAGYTPAQVLELLVGVTMKTLSNYTNHLTEPPLDQPFQARQWTPTPPLDDEGPR